MLSLSKYKFLLVLVIPSGVFHGVVAASFRLTPTTLVEFFWSTVFAPIGEIFLQKKIKLIYKPSMAQTFLM